MFVFSSLVNTCKLFYFLNCLADKWREVVENVRDLLTALQKHQLIEPLHFSLMVNIDTAVAARSVVGNLALHRHTRIAGNIRVVVVWVRLPSVSAVIFGLRKEPNMTRKTDSCTMIAMLVCAIVELVQSNSIYVLIMYVNAIYLPLINNYNRQHTHEQAHNFFLKKKI